MGASTYLLDGLALEQIDVQQRILGILQQVDQPGDGSLELHEVLRLLRGCLRRLLQLQLISTRRAGGEGAVRRGCGQCVAQSVSGQRAAGCAAHRGCDCRGGRRLASTRLQLQKAVADALRLRLVDDAAHADDMLQGMTELQLKVRVVRLQDAVLDAHRQLQGRICMSLRLMSYLNI